MTFSPRFTPFLKSACTKRLALCLLALACLLAAGCATAVNPPAPQSAAVAGPQEAEEQLGIKVEAIRWSAEGYMLDFRYRVVDPEKALHTIMDRSIKPYLIDEASGAKFLIPSSPKVGPMRQTTRRPETGRIYWQLFANPARYVKPGSQVTIVVGDYRLQHLVVQ